MARLDLLCCWLPLAFLVCFSSCTRFDGAGAEPLFGAACVDTPCDVDSSQPICDAQVQQCRGCQLGDACPDGLVCEPETGECTVSPCSPEDNACGSQAPVCGIDGLCEPCQLGASGDEACAAHGEWPTPLPYCIDAGDGSTFCAECRDANDCSAPGEVCTEDQICGACTAHWQCASEVCIDGLCTPPVDIMYIDPLDPNSDDLGPCSDVQPCVTISAALALLGFDHREIVMVRGDANVTYIEQLVIDAERVTLIGQGSHVMPPAALDNQPIVDIRGGAEVRIESLNIIGADGMDGADGIHCSGDSSVHLYDLRVADHRGQGIDATACDLVVERSYISGNTRGGIQIQNASFILANNFIVLNGDVFDNIFGGVRISNLGAISPQILDFNTIARNQTGVGGLSTGLSCTAAVGTPMDGHGNIIHEGLGAEPVQLSNCVLHYSNVEMQLPAGTGNINVQPVFAGAAQGNFHLLESSPGIDVEGLSSSYCDAGCVDWDGQPRPYGGLYDMGADEYVPFP